MRVFGLRKASAFGVRVRRVSWSTERVALCSGSSAPDLFFSRFLSFVFSGGVGRWRVNLTSAWRLVGSASRRHLPGSDYGSCILIYGIRGESSMALCHCRVSCASSLFCSSLGSPALLSWRVVAKAVIEALCPVPASTPRLLMVTSSVEIIGTQLLWRRHENSRHPRQQGEPYLIVIFVDG
uniref:Uncharacterized protein n=1 Tax=Brassica campestris TaxID=3711 RepID=M4EB43_BRACM